jgi:hypothetical protein
MGEMRNAYRILCGKAGSKIPNKETYSQMGR